YLLAGSTQSLAQQAIAVQQASNAVTTSADVLDLIKLNETGLVLADSTTYLAALPDSAANLDFTVHWNDISNLVATANSNLGNSNTAAEIQLVAPPQVLLGQRDIQFLTLVNNDRINANVALYFNTSNGNI